MKPAFLLTIDTEGDNLWARPSKITTENSHQFVVITCWLPVPMRLLDASRYFTR